MRGAATRRPRSLRTEPAPRSRWRPAGRHGDGGGGGLLLGFGGGCLGGLADTGHRGGHGVDTGSHGRHRGHGRLSGGLDSNGLGGLVGSSGLTPRGASAGTTRGSLSGLLGVGGSLGGGLGALVGHRRRSGLVGGGSTGGHGNPTRGTPARTTRGSVLGSLGVLGRGGGFSGRTGGIGDHGLGGLRRRGSTSGRGRPTHRAATRTGRRRLLGHSTLERGLFGGGRTRLLGDGCGGSHRHHGLGGLCSRRRSGRRGRATHSTPTRTTGRGGLRRPLRLFGVLGLFGIRGFRGRLGHGGNDGVDALLALLGRLGVFGQGRHIGGIGDRYGRLDHLCGLRLGGSRRRAGRAGRGTAPPARRQGVAGSVQFGTLVGFGRFEHAGVSPVRLPGAAPGPAVCR